MTCSSCISLSELRLRRTFRPALLSPIWCFTKYQSASYHCVHPQHGLLILHVALPKISSEDVIHIHHHPILQNLQFLSVEPATLRMFLSLNIFGFLFVSIQLSFILLMKPLMVKRLRLKERSILSFNIGRVCERHMSTRPVHACNRYIW